MARCCSSLRTGGGGGGGGIPWDSCVGLWVLFASMSSIVLMLPAWRRSEDTSGVLILRSLAWRELDC